MLVIMGFLILQDKNKRLSQPGGSSNQPLQALVEFPASLESCQSWQVWWSSWTSCCGEVSALSVTSILVPVSSLWTIFGPGASVPPGAGLAFPPPHPCLLVRARQAVPGSCLRAHLFVSRQFSNHSFGSHFASSGASTSTLEDNLVLP